MKNEVSVRPYWHVDVKWIFGILFFISLTVSLLAFTLSRLTSPDTAIPIATYVVASQFSREGLDDPTAVEAFREEYADSDEDVFYPLEGMEVAITREDLYSLSPREIRLKLFRQVVEPIYYQETSNESLGEYGVLAAINHQTHNTLRRIFLTTLVPVLLFGAGLVFFSYRYGRLISPASILLFLGAVPSLLLYLIQNSPPPPGDEGPLSVLPREVVLEVASSVSPIFYGIFLAGIGFMLVAVVIKLAVTFKNDPA